MVRLVWRRKSAPRVTAARIPIETVTLIRRLAAENRLWSADRIQGELLKLGVRASKRTIQKYMQPARAPGPSGQRWATFLRNHADDIWACDFLPVTDLWFRPLFAFFVIALGSRRVVHVGVTRLKGVNTPSGAVNRARPPRGRTHGSARRAHR